MGDKTAIEWTDATWNPIKAASGEGRWTCARISPGCEFCYASRLNVRFGGPEYGRDVFPDVKANLSGKALTEPLHWKRPRMVFVCSMTDLFGSWVPDWWLDEIFAVMAACPQHTFQILTKRPTRMQQYLANPATRERISRVLLDKGEYVADGRAVRDPVDNWPLPNVWAGVSVELDRFTWRTSDLLATPAAVRFISAEPLLGPLDSLSLAGIDWLIVGGESGGPSGRALVYRHCARGCMSASRIPFAEDTCAGLGWMPKPEAVGWVRNLRDYAIAANTAFLFKQWGGPTPKAGSRLLDGHFWDQFPTARAQVTA